MIAKNLRKVNPFDKLRIDAEHSRGINKSRQANITREIIEITAGAESLQ